MQSPRNRLFFKGLPRALRWSWNDSDWGEFRFKSPGLPLLEAEVQEPELDLDELSGELGMWNACFEEAQAINRFMDILWQYMDSCWKKKKYGRKPNIQFAYDIAEELGIPERDVEWVWKPICQWFEAHYLNETGLYRNLKT